MIFAAKTEDQNELLLAASSHGIAHFNTFIEEASAKGAAISDIGMIRRVKDRAIQAFTKMPKSATFESLSDLNAFVVKYSVQVVNHGDACHEQTKMLSSAELDDNRSIREIYKLDEHDPWDTRTEEQKAAIAAAQAAQKKKKNDTENTEGSWGSGLPEGDKIRVGKIDVEIDEDGNVTINRIHAQKGDIRIINTITIKDGAQADYEAVLKKARLDTEDATTTITDDGMIVVTHEGGADTENLRAALEGIDHTHEVADIAPERVGDPDWLIAEDEMVAIYYRLDVRDHKLADVEPLLVAGGMRASFKAMDVSDGSQCWLAYVREQSAVDNQVILSGAGIISDIIAVDRFGDRIIAEDADAQVVDSAAADVEPPMPWNAGADEFAKLTEEEQHKALKGKWFIFTVRDYGAPYQRIIHITPLTYFRDNRRLWEGELPIEHLFKRYSIPIERFGDAPGMYQCKALDVTALEFMLSNKIGMVDSFLLRGTVNSYVDGDQRTPMKL